MEAFFHRHLGPLQRWARGQLPTWARDMSDTDDLSRTHLLERLRWTTSIRAVSVHSRLSSTSGRQSRPRRVGAKGTPNRTRPTSLTSSSAAISHRSRTRLARDARTLRGGARGSPRGARSHRGARRDGVQLRGVGSGARETNGDAARRPHNAHSSALPKRWGCCVSDRLTVSWRVQS